MAHYKNVKYPALMLFSFCMSLDAFGATAVSASQTSLEAGDMPPKRVRIEVLPTPSIQDIQSILSHKSQVLGTVLPEARKNLSLIEAALLAKIKSMRETDFRRATELAGLVSSVKGLDGSSHSIFVLATQDCKDADSLAMAGMAISASGALKEEFSQLTALLAKAEDTSDIDCGILEGAIKAIHEITQDIYNPILSE